MSQAATLRLPPRPSVPDHLTLLAQASGAAVLREWTGSRGTAIDSDFFDRVVALTGNASTPTSVPTPNTAAGSSSAVAWNPCSAR
ncbi:hypothetical protein NKH18_39740 [Streptomyces sp. M10(2022)]